MVSACYYVYVLYMLTTITSLVCDCVCILVRQSLGSEVTGSHYHFRILLSSSKYSLSLSLSLSMSYATSISQLRLVYKFSSKLAMATDLNDPMGNKCACTRTHKQPYTHTLIKHMP